MIDSEIQKLIDSLDALEDDSPLELAERLLLETKLKLVQDHDEKDDTP